MNKGLGRFYIPDDRDGNYPLEALLPRKADLPTYKYWSQSGWWGDQGALPQCVGFGWAHWLEDGPVTQKGVAPIVKPELIYKEAQKVDEWEGTDYEGTSVRAGAKVLKGLGFISAYHWASKVDDVVTAVLTEGPVVIGVNWYSDMNFPNAAGLITPTGEAIGGHCLMINGVNVPKGLFKLKNSWGRSWGKKGNVWISIADFEKLLKEDGEACLAVEANGNPAS